MKIVGWVVIVFMICGAAIVTDITYGRFSEIALVRQDAQNFRNEASYTFFSTKNIVPRTDHVYRLPNRAEGEELLENTEPRHFRANAVGAIEPVRVARVGVPRIAFLGGSTTENNEVDEPFRFPSMVSRVLEKNGIEATTINFGVRGHTSIDSVNVLINRQQDLNADYVVLMHNINDRFRSASDQGYSAVPGTERMSSSEAVVNAAWHLLRAAWDYMSYRSNLLFTLRFNENINEAFRDDHGPRKDNEGNIVVPDGGRNEPDSMAFSRNLRVFIAAARALGKKPILMTQPLGHHDDNHETFNDVIREVATSENVWLVDLSVALGKNPRWAFLSDDIHFNNNGSIAAAEAISAVLSKSIWGRETADNEPRPKIVTLPELATRCSTNGSGELKPGNPWYLGGLRGRYPSISADGKWLLFQERVGATDRIRLADLANGKVHEIIPEEPSLSERHPAFVEVQERHVKIIYGKGAEDDNPDKIERLVELLWPGMKRRTITSTTLSGSIPAARGGRIIFAGSQGKAPDLYELAGSETQPNRLTNTEWEEWHPTISSQGDVYFISNEGGNFDVYKRTPDGTITKVWGTSADEWDPSLSSDGGYLAFASQQYGNWNLYILPLDNSNQSPIQVTSDGGDEWDPSFVNRWNMLIFAKAENSGSYLMGICLHGEKNAE